MSKRSLSLADKLAARFTPDQDVMEATDLVSKATSGLVFNSKKEFEDNLVEGALLNVSVIASRALSVPQGEYLVWMTDAGHTMLVPTAEKRGNREVYEHTADAYEVQTRDLMANWNRLERTIAENGPPLNQGNLQQGDNEEYLQEPPEGEPGDEKEGRAGEFRSTIDASTVDRTPIMRAMQDRGFTVTSLANEVGVDPPAISRILRTPKDVQGDPGGRNPSMGLASQICNVLRIDPTAAFPDIFNQNEKYQARQQPGNDGSGSHSHGKGGGKWNQGGKNLPESVGLGDSIVLLEATQNYQTLCQMIAESGVPFNQFWHEVFIPTLLRTTARSNAATLTESLINEMWPFSHDKAPAPQANTSNPFAVPSSYPSFSPDQGKFDNAVKKMNSQILPAIQQAFQKSMKTLKQDLQKVQMAAGADPKIAPHAWKVADQFYKNVVKNGMEWLPKWKAQQKGTGNSYDSAYQKAAADFRARGAPGAGVGAPGATDQDDFSADPLATGNTGLARTGPNAMAVPGHGGMMPDDNEELTDEQIEQLREMYRQRVRGNRGLGAGGGNALPPRPVQAFPALGAGSGNGNAFARRS
jgi:DNA-binding XRE family transcriptional regulator